MLIRQRVDRNMLEVFERIPMQKMTRFVDLSQFWTKETNLSVEKAREMTGLDKRTLSAARRGFLDRCQIDTIYKLLELASQLAGREVEFKEIIRNDETR